MEVLTVSYYGVGLSPNLVHVDAVLVVGTSQMAVVSEDRRGEGTTRSSPAQTLHMESEARQQVIKIRLYFARWYCKSTGLHIASRMGLDYLDLGKIGRGIEEEHDADYSKERSFAHSNGKVPERKEAAEGIGTLRGSDEICLKCTIP